MCSAGADSPVGGRDMGIRRLVAAARCGGTVASWQGRPCREAAHGWDAGGCQLVGEPRSGGARSARGPVDGIGYWIGQLAGTFSQTTSQLAPCCGLNLKFPAGRCVKARSNRRGGPPESSALDASGSGGPAANTGRREIRQLAGGALGGAGIRQLVGQGGAPVGGGGGADPRPRPPRGQAEVLNKANLTKCS